MICIFGNTTTENCRFCTALYCPSRPCEDVVTTNNTGTVLKLKNNMTTDEFNKHREEYESAAHNLLIGIEKMQKLVDKAILLTKNNK